MSDLEKEVDIELAEDYEAEMKDRFFEVCADLPGFRPEVAIREAEIEAIKGFLFRSGTCSQAEFAMAVGDNINEALQNMASAGFEADSIALDNE